jgi:RimJ/RimL family protein N-acetyltransferase
MSKAVGYCAVETLRTGKLVEIRALRPEDREALVAAVRRASPESLYRRFFGPKRDFSEQEVDYFVNVDFVDHVALVAVVEEDGTPVIVGGARYVVTRPGQAEVAFAVVDQYQGQGIAKALLHHIAALARGAGVHELIAEALPENAPMLKVFAKSGLDATIQREPQVVHIKLQLS